MPQKMKIIKNPPNIIYALGNLKLLTKKSFGIVGTRQITDYGERNCKYFVKELVLRNVPIVSGMALGTDTIAHKTVLENGGETIAVLGSGFNKIFPKENSKLFEEIIKNGGLIISEYEPNIEANKENFPRRNRIITALSEGILVIEAGYRSGTSITARHAKQQGKKVFAVPGRIDSSVGIGVNELIKKGAILTVNVKDILKYFPEFNVKRKNINTVKINKKYEKIVNILKEGEKSIQELINLSDMTVYEIFDVLTKMELENIISKNYLGKYALVKI